MWPDVGPEFIYIWAGLYLVQLVYLGWNDNWLIKKLSYILMGWLYANGPNANWPTSLLPHNCSRQHSYGSHAITTFHVIVMLAKTLIYTLSLPSTSSSCQQSHHPSCHPCVMVIVSVTKIILFVTFIFVIENGFGLGFEGPGYFMTVSKRHRSSNRWWNFNKHHEV